MLRTSIVVLLTCISAVAGQGADAVTQAETLYDSSSSSKSCTLACPDNAPCTLGENSFDSHPTHADGTSFDFLDKKNVDNMHCACPEGLTGVQCDTKYETCDGTEHQCYNGGNCIHGLIDEFGNEQLFCDCGNAVGSDGTRYTGKYCEHPVLEYCDAEQTAYCVNGGSCNPDYRDKGSGTPCQCPAGFEGANCQYTVDSVPDCDLQCDNGGQCVFDSPSKDELNDQYQYWDYNKDGPPKYMRCDCPDAFDGHTCEIAKTPCGDDHCFNGATCIERVVDGQTVFHCDCTTSYTNTASFAGRFCQYEATSYCSKETAATNGHLFCVNGGRCRQDVYQGCECDPEFTGFSCEFVTSEFKGSADHHGEMSDIGSVIYEQDEGTSSNATGPAEAGTVIYDSNSDAFSNAGRPIIDPTDEVDCNLKCENNGVCRFGKKIVGGALSEMAENAPHLKNATSHEENFQHCICPDGFFGAYCEEKIEICGAGEHMCLHGSKCIRDDQDEHACDCSDTDSDIADNFAGNSCEHPVNDICTINSQLDASPLAFCVNGGQCKKKVTAQEDHPGCNCVDDFYGPHCELKKASTLPNGDASDTTSSNNNAGDSNSQEPPIVPEPANELTSSASDIRPTYEGPSRALDIAVIVMSGIAILVVGVFSAFLYMRSRDRRRNVDLTDSLRWTTSYRDVHPRRSRSINIAPRRTSYLDNPDGGESGDADGGDYNAHAHSSSTDPMATHLAPKSAASGSSTTSSGMAGGADTSESASVNNDAVIVEPDHLRDEQEGAPQVYIGPPRDEDGHELHNVEII